MEMARNTAPSSFPKNYVTLRQLQELRLKEKRDEEERIRLSNLNRNPQRNPHAGTEAKRDDEERLRNLNLKEGEGKEAATRNREPFRSRAKLPSNGLRSVVVGWAPRAPISMADGATGGGAGADPRPPIGEGAGGNPNAEVNQKKKKSKKKKKRQAGDGNKKGDAVSAEAAAAAEEVNGSRIVAADPPPEESVQVKQVAGRNPRGKTARKNSKIRRDGPSQPEEPNGSKSVAADPSPLEKPIQLDEVKPVEGDGPKRTVKVERPGIINEADAAAGTPRRRMRNGMAGVAGVGGRRGRSANKAGSVLVWVRKTATS